MFIRSFIELSGPPPCTAHIEYKVYEGLRLNGQHMINVTGNEARPAPEFPLAHKEKIAEIGGCLESTCAHNNNGLSSSTTYLMRGLITITLLSTSPSRSHGSGTCSIFPLNLMCKFIMSKHISQHF